MAFFNDEKNHEFILTLLTITVEIMTKEDADKTLVFFQRNLEASVTSVMEKKAGQHSAKGKNEPVILKQISPSSIDFSEVITLYLSFGPSTNCSTYE